MKKRHNHTMTTALPQPVIIKANDGTIDSSQVSCSIATFGESAAA